MSRKQLVLAVSGFAATFAMLAAVPGGLVGTWTPLMIIIWLYNKLQPSGRDRLLFAAAVLVVGFLGLLTKNALWAGDPHVQAAWQRLHYYQPNSQP